MQNAPGLSIGIVAQLLQQWPCAVVQDVKESGYVVQEILTESFDPILDLVTGADLMMAMVYAQELGDWDYTGMYTAILRRRVRRPRSNPSLSLFPSRAVCLHGTLLETTNLPCKHMG